MQAHAEPSCMHEQALARQQLITKAQNEARF